MVMNYTWVHFFVINMQLYSKENHDIKFKRHILLSSRTWNMLIFPPNVSQDGRKMSSTLDLLVINMLRSEQAMQQAQLQPQLPQRV